MKYIGYTLSGCLDSIRRKEVSADDVLLIIAGTKCHNYKDYIKVVESYIGDWTIAPEICLSTDQIMEVASDFYTSGRIHQPRLTFSDTNNFYTPYRTKPGDPDSRVWPSVWGHVVPTPHNTTPAVVAAWEHYRLLDSLTK